MRPCKRLVACHIVPYSFTGRLHGRLPYCVCSTNRQLSRVAVQATGRLWLIHMYPVWSLAWSLVVVCKVLDLYISGGHASDWFQCTCTGRLHGRLCRVRDFAGKVILGESNTVSSSDRASAWSLALFLT